MVEANQRPLGAGDQSPNVIPPKLNVRGEDGCWAFDHNAPPRGRGDGGVSDHGVNRENGKKLESLRVRQKECWTKSQNTDIAASLHPGQVMNFP